MSSAAEWRGTTATGLSVDQQKPAKRDGPTAAIIIDDTGVEQRERQPRWKGNPDEALKEYPCF